MKGVLQDGLSAVQIFVHYNPTLLPFRLYCVPAIEYRKLTNSIFLSYQKSLSTSRTQAKKVVRIEKVYCVDADGSVFLESATIIA